jgi:hypothetical protein
MAIVIDDVELERLAEQIAKAEGVPVAEVVRESLRSLAGQRGFETGRLSLRERLAALAREVDAVPPCEPADLRSDDEILGYDGNGAW